MLTDSFICEVTCSAHMSDHLSLVTNNCRMRTLFVARPFLVVCAEPILLFILFMVVHNLAF